MSNLLKLGFVWVDPTKIIAVDPMWDTEHDLWRVLALLSSGHSACLREYKDKVSAIEDAAEFVELLRQHERTSVLSAVTEAKSAAPSVRKRTPTAGEVDD